MRAVFGILAGIGFFLCMCNNNLLVTAAGVGFLAGAWYVSWRFRID